MSRGDNTLLQFGRSLRDDGSDARAPREAPRATFCHICRQHFGADGRFCPFDGEPLVPASDWDPARDPLLHTVVDHRYEVLSVIGEGGMGTVYMVQHTALGKRFALKVLRKELASDGEIAARFIQEARTAASVSHPGLVEITDYGRLPTGQAYFVMELLQGRSLAALLRGGERLPLGRAVDIVAQLAEALKAAHDAGIVHRDLKPDNVHVGSAEGGRERVKIVDFGLAQVVGSARVTRQGVVFGTPHYMSPEQASGEPVDHRADIYALGVLMYEMLTGRVPFEADTYMGVLTKHMYMEPTPPSRITEGAVALGTLEDIVMRCLEKNPDRRYADLGEFLIDLRNVAVLRADGQVELRSRVRRSSAPARRSDEPPLLSEDEIEGRAPRSSNVVPIALVGLAFASGLSLMLLSRSCRREPEARPAVQSAPARTTVASSVPKPPPPAPAKPPPVVEVAAAPPASASAAPKVPVAAQKPARRPPVSEPTPQPKTPIGGREIIDPWAER